MHAVLEARKWRGSGSVRRELGNVNIAVRPAGNRNISRARGLHTYPTVGRDNRASGLIESSPSPWQGSHVRVLRAPRRTGPWPGGNGYLSGQRHVSPPVQGPEPYVGRRPEGHRGAPASILPLRGGPDLTLRLSQGLLEVADQIECAHTRDQPPVPHLVNLPLEVCDVLIGEIRR